MIERSRLFCYDYGVVHRVAGDGSVRGIIYVEEDDYLRFAYEKK